MEKNKAQIKANDEKWAKKSWKPFLWMAIGGTVLLIIGLALFIAAPFATTSSSDAAAMLALIIPGYILMIVGGLVTDGGIALIVVTAIKSNRAKARLGLKK